MLQPFFFPKTVKFLFQVNLSEQSAGSVLVSFSWDKELAHPSLQALGYWEEGSIFLTFVLVPYGHLLSLFASPPLEKSFVLAIAN